MATVLWLTGLSGAGKSTIADALMSLLESGPISATRLDGDDLRRGLNSDLGFSAEDRKENLRRAAHVARLMGNCVDLVICSFITPLEEDRAMIAEILGSRYVEVYVQASLKTCEARDPKGLYKRARRGEIADFTGISSPYERPEHAHVILNTESSAVGQVVEQLANSLATLGVFGVHLT